MTAAGFPHSEILGSRFVCQLPEAYRRLLRPSSAPGAKASTLCTYKLDHKDHSKMLASTVQFSSNHRSPPAPGAYRTRTTTTPKGSTSADPAVQPDRRSRPRQHPLTGCSLRTQQRARPTRTEPVDLRSLLPGEPESVLGATSSTSRPVVDVPPSSTTPIAFGPGVGLDNHPAP